MRAAMQAGLDALKESWDDVASTLHGYQSVKGSPSHDRRAKLYAEQLDRHAAAIAQLEAALAAPVEPVGYFVLSEGQPEMGIPKTWLQVAEGREAEGQPLYAAPVAGRVISDAEIDAIARPHSIETETGIEFTERGLIEFARAIIAKTEGK